ncbi:MAG: hypothetical protein JNL08_09555 [Planctomycetes bacterium]|nr:hypothetical protein [Planctomycetota bacterium]
MSRGARAFAALLVAAALPAQERTIVHGKDAVVVRATPYHGSPVSGGFGFLVVAVENREAAPHRVVVDLATPQWAQQSNIAVRRELALGPNETGRCVLPLPTSADRSLALDLTVDDTSYPGSIGGRTDSVVALLVGRPELEPWAGTVLQAWVRAPRATTEVTVAPPDDLPRDWRWLTGFHVVVVDGKSAIGEDVQATLCDLASAGGTVVVADVDRLPPGALRTRCGDRHRGVVPLGIGRCVLATPTGDQGHLHDALAQLPQTELAGWPLADSLQRLLVVPGLGEAPVLLFLLVVLAFAVVVGPVNFVLLRRWKRPLLVLVTVPACGLCTTVAMLLFGLLHDGLGVRGAVRSWSRIDQDRHEAQSLVQATLFAGLSPDVLALQPDAVLIAPRASWRRDRRATDRWQFDPVANVLDGGVLPAREATPLVSARHGTARQRLRARLVGERVELLTDGGVVPVGPVLLRDPDGRYWLGEAPALLPVAADAARQALERWQREAGAVELRDDDGAVELASAHHVVERLLPGGELPPGGYVARVAAAPWLDDHGLQVDWDRADHFLAGTFAAEDFLR